MEPSEMELKLVGIDTSKHVFTLHGVDASGTAVLRRDLRRSAFEAYMAKLTPTEVALEACGGAHHWARRLTAMGHRVRLIPPQYVKPYVKRSKTDRADAEAICEAASCPSMRFVPVKTAERQGELMVPRTRELLVRQRTQAVNALRGHATEFGLVVPLGVSRVEELLAKLATDPGVPEIAREMLALLGRQIEQIDAQVRDRRPAARHAQGGRDEPAFGEGARRRADHRDQPRIERGSGTVRERPPSRRLAWADAARTLQRRQAASGRASAEPAMSGCGNCWSSARRP